MSSFGERLLEAFGDVPKGKIADIMGVKPSAVTNYLEGRVPDEEKLKRISDFTNCSIHWLITGEGEKFLNKSKEVNLDDTFREVIQDYVKKEVSRQLNERTIVVSSDKIKSQKEKKD